MQDIGTVAVNANVLVKQLFLQPIVFFFSSNKWNRGAAEIDAINILNASFLAMHRAIDQLTLKPEYLIIDGNRFNPYPNLSHTCIVKGDAKYMSIAAASILAKTARDRLMLQMHERYPQYHWQNNKGYPTADHRKAIETFGSCDFHRKSFQLLPAQLSLFSK